MATEIRVPALGESVVEATVGQWFKQAGDAVSADEPLVELETNKVTVEVPAPASGVLADIVVNAGDTVAVGALLGAITEGDGKAKPAKAKSKEATSKEAPKPAAAKAATPPPAAPKKLEREPHPREEIAPDTYDIEKTTDEMPPSPAARKLLAESGLKTGDVKGSGRRGQVLKGDVTAQAAEALLTRERKPKPPAPPRAPVVADDSAREVRVRMTRLRLTIAKRREEAQDTAAMLTTFNDVVSVAAVSCASFRRLAMVRRSRVMRTRSSRALSSATTGARGGAGGFGFRSRVSSASAACAVTSPFSTWPRRPEPFTSPVFKPLSASSLRAAGEGGISSVVFSMS